MARWMMLKAPERFPAMRFYQLWHEHEHAHHAAAHRWLRSVIAEVSRRCLRHAARPF